MSAKEILGGGAVIGLLAFFAAPQADRNSAGEIVSEGTVDIFQIQIGDCFDDAPSVQMDETVELTGVGGVPCSQPHDNEVYAATDLTMSSYPGEAAILRSAEKFCFDEFQGYVGTTYENSILDITYIFPTQQSWQQLDDREIACAVFDMNLQKLTGSVKGRAL